MKDIKKTFKEINTKLILDIKLTVMLSILEVHHQRKNKMVSNVACVITSSLLMVSTIRSNLALFAYL